jgi:hypothetical protein
MHLFFSVLALVERNFFAGRDDSAVHVPAQSVTKMHRGRDTTDLNSPSNFCSSTVNLPMGARR